MSKLGQLVALLMAGLLIAAAAVVVLVVLPDHDSEPDHPDEWDTRVESFVEIVERERGLDFEHPVRVDFLTEEEFEEQVTAEEADLSEEEKEEIEQSTGLMRALGLIDGDTDLFDVVNEAMAGGVVGLYDHDDERVRLRGEELDPALESTLVHELTHALQDQHFDIGARTEELEEAEDSSAAAVWDALVEGDARRIETAWAGSLSAEAREELSEAEQEVGQKASKRLAQLPEFVTTTISSPYVFGEAMLALAVELDGNDAVDDLFADPPVSEEHLLDPWTLLEDDDQPLEVDRPDLDDGDQEFDSGTFGAPSWLFLLAEQVDVADALVAADGWGGDHYVAFERGDRSCMRIDYVGDEPSDTAELRRSLHAWVAARPDGSATVSDRGDGLRFEACDPGTDAPGGNDGSSSALSLAVTRTQLATQSIMGGADATQSRCFARELVLAFTPEQFASPEFGQDPETVGRIQEIAARCR